MGEMFGTLLRRFRERKGWTITELAEAVGAGRKSITDWEAERRVPRDRARLEDLAQVLGLSQAESDALFASARGTTHSEPNELIAVTLTLDAEARYLTDLITELEKRKGVLAYVELAAQADAPDETRTPSVVEEWGLEIAFTLLEVPRRDEPMAERRKIPLTNILEAVQQHRRFVLIGDPGGGKTTTLQRLVLDAARACLAEPAAPLPLLLTLPSWRDEPTPAAFIRAHWPLSSDPLSLLTQGDVWLYLDGLNEMGADGPRKARLLRDWLRAPDAPKHVIITCRAQDYTGDLLLDLPTVLAEPLDDKRIEQFATCYLEDTAVRFLARVLPQHDEERRNARHLIHLARNPFLLTALLVVYRGSPDRDLPRNPGALMQRLVAALWKREEQRQTSGWVSLDTMQAAFATLAFAMIDQGQSVVVPKTWAAQQIVEQRLGDGITVEALFHVGQRANLLIMQDSQVQFSHQLLQEYFAAVELERHGVVAYLTDPRFDIFQRKPTQWDHVIIALCGITRDGDAVVGTIMQIDPFLAADCLASSSGIAPTLQHNLIARLLGALGYPARWVRKDAAGVWGLIWDVMHSTGRYPKEDVRRSAVSALKKIGNRSMPGLLDALLDSDDNVRYRAAEALRPIRDTAAVPGLIDALRDPHEQVRYLAVRVLRKIRDVATVSGLLDALRDPQKAVPGLIDALRDPDERMRQAAVWALRKIGDVAVPGLLDTLRNPNDDVRYSAVLVLGQIGNAVAVPALLDALHDPGRNVRQGAAEALGRIRDPTAVSGLLDALRDPHDDIRYSAAEALGRIRDPTAVSGLLDALRDPHEQVRKAVARALEQIGDAAVPGLLDTLRDPHEQVRFIAADVLVSIRDPAAIPAAIPVLLQALHDPEPFVCFTAASALGQIRDGAIPGVLDALRDQDVDVRKVTTIAPGQTEEAAAIPAAIPALLQALRDPHDDIRYFAALLLGQIGNAAAIPVLLQALRDPQDDVRRAAADVLGQIGDAAMPELLDTLRDPNEQVRQVVAEALGQIGDLAVSGLLDTLRDPHERVREAAASALERIGTPEARIALSEWRRTQGTSG